MIKNELIKNAKIIDKFLIKYLNKQNKSLLINPMKYGVISGGKKIRSTVILSTGKIFNSNQNYAQINVSDGGSAPYSSFTTNKFPQNFASGSFTFTLTDDSNPSLLINLPKNNHLQDGIGQKGFIIIPENIHPHVKKNLTYFLAKAGVPLGIDVVPALDNEFKKLR